jgi:SAM-dependent methyltransferase
VTESFDGDWLDRREPADARARDMRLALMLSDALPKRPHLIDLGAGTGSLFRWMAPLIGRAQAWTLVDADRDLLDRAFETIAERAEDVGFRISAPAKRTLLVHTPAGAWRIEGLVVDLADAPHGLPLDKADAVVCTALCDLVSRHWVRRMAKKLRVPFYAALNVDGRDRFLPPHPVDRAIAAGFRRDQGRDKGFDGPALGPDATRAMAEAFRKRGFGVTTAPSPWRLGRGDTGMLIDLVQVHAGAAAAHRPRDAGVAAWRAARLRQASVGRLAARIGHSDLLALPGK